MATVKLKDVLKSLPQDTSLTGSEMVVINDNGENKYIPYSTIRNGLVNASERRTLANTAEWLIAHDNVTTIDALNKELDAFSAETAQGLHRMKCFGIPLFVTFANLNVGDSVLMQTIQGSITFNSAKTSIASINTVGNLAIAVRYYQGGKWGAWNTPMAQIKPPTVQSSTSGTKANYVYSQGKDQDAKTIVTSKFWIYKHNDYNLFLRFKHWGANNDEAEANFSQVQLPNAWTQSNGLLRRDIYARLDAFKLREQNSTATEVKVVTPIFTTGGTRELSISAATTAKAGVMTASDKQQVSDNTNAIKSIRNLLNINKAYGVEFDTSVSSPTCTRIGNMGLHKSLPVQSLMRGCLLNDDGKVNKYLDANDWTSETRDGSQGQVMVEIPEFWWKFEEEGTKRRVWLCAEEISTFKHHPKQYVSAYEATVQRSTNKLCSVVNEDADYRGGNNYAGYDGTYRSFLGRPVTSISRTNFRNYARKRKSGSTEWNCMTYDMQKTLYWLFVVEYATLNSQADFNSEPTAEGFRQGGLGKGVTAFSGNDWNKFNGSNSFVPCGISDSLGNRTGVVDYTVNNEAESNPIAKTFQVPRYRGVENPFGHIWKWLDGINVRFSPNADKGGDGLSRVFVCADPAKFSDSNYEGYSHVGNEVRQENYVKEVIFGDGGEIEPKTVGGGSTTYFCDYFYTNIPNAETLRGVLSGSTATGGQAAGVVSLTSFYAPSYAAGNIGSRLCFIPTTA